MVQQNKKLKEYIANIKQTKVPTVPATTATRAFFKRKGKGRKKYKKVVYEEETDSEPEEEESQYATEDEIVKQEKQEEQKQPHIKRKNNIFDCLSRDAKRNKS